MEASRGVPQGPVLRAPTFLPYITELEAQLQLPNLAFAGDMRVVRAINFGMFVKDVFWAVGYASKGKHDSSVNQCLRRTNRRGRKLVRFIRLMI